MRRFKKQVIPAVAIAIAAVLTASSAQALTAQEIVTSVVGELDDVTDFTATVDSDYSDPANEDMAGGSMQWKRTTGTTRKVKMVAGTPYTEIYKTDGGGYWNVGPTDSFEIWPADLATGFIRFNTAADLFDVEVVLQTETWTKSATNETVNGIECYKLYTSKANTNYEVWIDVATAKKAVRVKATDEDNALQWQIDYSNYSRVESTVWVATTISTKRYAEGSLWGEATYTLSNIDINANLSDALFATVGR